MPRPELPPRASSPEIAQSYQLADRWSRSEVFQRAFDRAMTDPDQHRYALEDPNAFLRDAGAPVPPGLEITFLEVPPRALPGPGFEQFTIRLFNCRTFWVRDKPTLGKPGRWSSVQVCFGFEIIRNAGPGPLG
jgi:hypothetical protein